MLIGYHSYDNAIRVCVGRWLSARNSPYREQNVNAEWEEDECDYDEYEDELQEHQTELPVTDDMTFQRRLSLRSRSLNPSSQPGLMQKSSTPVRLTIRKPYRTTNHSESSTSESSQALCFIPVNVSKSAVRPYAAWTTPGYTRPWVLLWYWYQYPALAPWFLTMRNTSFGD